MLISRTKDNGFNVTKTFEDAKEVMEGKSQQPLHEWKKYEMKESNQQIEEQEQSFVSKLKSCFQSPLKCNPAVQLDYRGKGMNKNPLRTEFIMHPKTSNILFNNADKDFSAKSEGFIEFEMKEEADKPNTIDKMSQYILVQVLDNEVERDSQDRVVAESLLTFNGFEMDQINYCKIKIYDSVYGKDCGEVMMIARFNDEKLQIYVEHIKDLKDPNADLVKDDSTIQQDVTILISWIIYMILSILFYIYVEDFIFIDALYLRIVTAFTVGYGDLYPVTNAGKLLNCLFIIVDTVAIGFLTSKVMNYILRFRELVCLCIYIPFFCV